MLPGLGWSRMLISTATQSKNFIFMILEPNCSIIAACLPCYRPLLADGRTPESVVRNARAVFSLRSWSSKGSSINRGQSQPKDSDAIVSVSNGGGESQIELTQDPEEWSDWHMRGQNTVKVGRYPNKSDEEMGASNCQDIRMTTEVDVSRK
jgi:hypothetical protein